MSKSKLRSGKAARPAKAKPSLRKTPIKASKPKLTPTSKPKSKSKPQIRPKPETLLEPKVHTKKLSTTAVKTLGKIKRAVVKEIRASVPGIRAIASTVKQIVASELSANPETRAPISIPAVPDSAEPPALVKSETKSPVAAKGSAPIPIKAAALFKATQSLPEKQSLPAPSKAGPVGKPAPVKLPFKIPAILLEGDEPAKTAARDAGKAGAAPLAPPGSSAYGSGRLTATPRDPHCLYVHWDFTWEQQQQFNSASVHGAMVLRVKSDRSGELTQVHLHPDSRHWFVHVPDANVIYQAALGYYQADGGWVRVAESLEARTPSDQVAQDKTVRFARMPEERREVHQKSSEQRAELPSHLGQPRFEVRERHESLQGVIPPDVSVPLEFLPPRSDGSANWTSTQEEALEELVLGWLTRPQWFESGQIDQLVQGRTQRKRPRLDQGFAFPAPSSAEIALAALAPERGEAISSQALVPEQPRQRNFWFNINAELIVYGATEPNATVTIGNRPIRLRRDGSFSYRFALPDGYYELPAVATSLDGESRRANLRFTRSSEYQGEVGAHPQDQALKVPAPENTV
jgi:uncharacterized protein